MVTTLWEFSVWWWSWISSLSVQTTLLIVLVWGVERLTRGRLWPDILHAAWLLVMVRVLLPVSLPSYARLADIAPIPTLDATSVTMVSSGPAVGVSEAIPWVSIGMLVWITGILIMTGWIIHAVRSYRRMFQSSVSASETWIYEALQKAARRVGLRRCPAYLLSDSISSAGVFGLFRPVVVLPINTEPGPETDHILLHECAHIKRRDPLLHALSLTAVVLMWFNPLIWLAHRRLLRLREVCCDAMVAGILREETSGYRRTLLTVAEKLIHARPAATIVGILGIVEESSMLITRIQWLDRNLWKNARTRMALKWSVVTLMAAVVFPMCSSESQPTGATSQSDAARVAAAQSDSALMMWQTDVRPVPVEQVIPEYPASLGDTGIGGMVFVEFIVTESGDVTNACIYEGSATGSSGAEITRNPVLEQAALEAVRQTKYRPGMLNGRAVAVKMMQRMVFSSPNTN